jgi:hypothetical protein
VPDWSVEQLRLTVFLDHEVREPVPNWWRDVVGQDPRIQTVQQGISIQHVGTVREGYCQLVLEVRGGRIDWLMTPQLAPNQIPTGFPSFDNYNAGAAVFRQLLLPWASRSQGVRRVAVGSVLTFPVQNKVAGYNELQGLLPALEIDPVGSSDLLYQINRHARSRAVEGLHVNRLSAWTVVQFKLVQFQIQAGGVPATIGTSAPELHAVRLQLDINTDADRGEPLPSGTIVPMIEELIALGGAIAEQGGSSMINFDGLLDWHAGFALRGGVSMLGAATPDDATVTRQAELPAGWIDVTSGTGSSESWGAAVVEGRSLNIRYQLIESAEDRTGYALFPTPRGSSMEPAPNRAQTQVRPQVQKNTAAIALLDSWLKEAELGIDKAQQRHLKKVKKALDSRRSPGHKLFK